MGFWKVAANRVAYLGRRRRFEREMAEEVAFHIETRAAELVAEGLGHGAAQAQARREFGPSLRVREESRSAWQVLWLEDLAGDLRYAARAFRRNPGFAATAIVCLALAVGANTTMFSVAMESLLGEPSCRDPQSLLQLSVSGSTWMAPQLRYLRDSGALPGVAGINIGVPANWRDGNGSRKIASMHVTDDFFEVAGIPVAAGRPIQRGESHAVVLTDGFWRRMGGDRGSIGRTMTIDGESYTIVGVLPRDHRMLAGWSFSPDLYLSKTLAEYQDRMDFTVYARLPRDMSRQAAYARLAPVCREMDRVFPDPRHTWTRGLRLSSVSGPEQLAAAGVPAAPVIAFFAMLVIVTGFVLLIACANVSSLLLARAFSRSHEIAIRMSIGGGRGRIVRQLLAESLLLAVCGTGAGLGLNLVLTRLASGFRIPTPLPDRIPDPAGLAAAGLFHGDRVRGHAGGRPGAGTEGDAARAERHAQTERTSGGRTAVGSAGSSGVGADRGLGAPAQRRLGFPAQPAGRLIGAPRFRRRTHDFGHAEGAAGRLHP